VAHAAVWSTLCFLVLPWSLRRTLTEPEPMASRRSDELAEFYEHQRRRRVLGMFWGLGVLLPGMMGTLLALMVWFPDETSLWNLLCSVGGVLVGIGGATFGTRMTVERARITELRTRLDRLPYGS